MSYDACRRHILPPVPLQPMGALACLSDLRVSRPPSPHRSLRISAVGFGVFTLLKALRVYAGRVAGLCRHNSATTFTSEGSDKKASHHVRAMHRNDGDACDMSLLYRS